MILETGEVLFLPWERLLWVWLWLFHSLTLASLLETELSLWLFLFASAQRAGLHDGGGRMPQRRWVFHFPLVFTAPRFLWFAFQPSVIAFEFSKWFIFSLSIWGWFEIADLLLSDVETHLLKTYSFQMTPFLWSLTAFKTGCDVEKNQFVGTLLTISTRQFYRVAGLAEVHEIGTFHCLPIFNVEARNDSFC